RVRREETPPPADLLPAPTAALSSEEAATTPTIAPRFLGDFAAMKQVVRRGYVRVLDDGGPFPDLIVIDGGKGQLNAAYEALEEVGLANLVAVGLAKRGEAVFVGDGEQPIG